MGFHLERNESLRSGLRRILVEQALRLGKDIAATTKDRKTAIHEVRKRCKRIRAIVRLLRPHAEPLYQRENAAFRDMARLLSPFRDADVRQEAFEALIQRAGDEGARLSSLGEFVIDASQDRNTENEFAIQTATIACQAQDAKERFTALDFPDGGDFDLIEPGLHRTYKQGQQHMMAAYDTGEQAAFHSWRKRVKDLGYQLQVLRDLWPPVLNLLHKEIDELGRLLGEEHDLAMVRHACLERSGANVPEEDLHAFLEFVEKRTGELRAQALPLGQRVYAEEAKDFTRRMHAYWQTWREERIVFV